MQRILGVVLLLAQHGTLISHITIMARQLVCSTSASTCIANVVGQWHPEQSVLSVDERECGNPAIFGICLAAIIFD